MSEEYFKVMCDCLFPVIELSHKKIIKCLKDKTNPQADLNSYLISLMKISHHSGYPISFEEFDILKPKSEKCS